MSITLTAPPSTRYAAVLDALHEKVSPGGLVVSSTGIVLASPQVLPDAPVRFGLAVSRGTPADPATLARFTGELLAAHRDLLRRTVDHAIRHLESRTSAGTTLLAKQMVQGNLADIALELTENTVLAGLGLDSKDTRWRSHSSLVTTGRALLKLLGASGFLSDGPAGELHQAEIAGNVYQGER
ncbi:hypothetical protein [Kibdelosporangium phytohabitans]|uniref:Acyl-CoA dehydrogenase/oxidase C-terminal domain-containing protein n=1 Tax=Kibdelosporangium phytohabitans TaxID=860235 RepID=A0A0N9I736_9PSEU|nr:hypothetical protein [Kibdelosporangium phytohabitans]ALG10438.1 hypothetical protein AOZ06_29260 [Kibdelosporangium phytohabitans]MBE1461510.1 hypothetical protein [Kibdelosporangium phytohabitans]